MTNQLTAQHLAEGYSEAARENYVRDGHLVPIVHLLDAEGAGVSLLPNPERFGGSPREQLASLVGMTADILDVVFLATITEGWMKAFPEAAASGQMPNLQRGQLSKESDTDPDIHTTAMVQVFDMRRMADSYAIMSTVKGDPRRPEWDVHAQAGPMEGGMPDDLMRMYWVAKTHQIPVDHTHTIEQRLKFLGDIGFIVAAMIAVTQPPTERNQ